MYRRVTGNDDVSFSNPIKPAPQPYVLKMFGGKLSIEEFRDAFENERVFSTSFAPMMPWSMFIDEDSGMASMRRGAANGNVKKPLKIRTAKKKEQEERNEDFMNSMPTGRSSEKRFDDRTTVNQLISFG